MKNNEYSLALLCDFYELTMGRGYFDTDKRNTIAYFDVFSEEYPTAEDTLSQPDLNR